jgi:hypothetical protein
MKENTKIIGGMDAILLLQAQRNKSLLEASKQKDAVAIMPDTAFLVALWTFDLLTLGIALLAAKIWGWW